MTEEKTPMQSYLDGKNTGVASSDNPDAMRGAAEHRKAELVQNAGAGVNAAFDSERNAAVGEGCGFIIVNIIPVVVSVGAICGAILHSAVFLGLVEAPQLGDMQEQSMYPDWLVAIFVGLAIGGFFLRKVLRGKVGWLITFSFLAWLFLMPPSKEISELRDKHRNWKQSIALDAALTELSGCLYSNEYLRSQGTVSSGCAGLEGELDSLLVAASPEVISWYCSTRHERSEDVFGSTWREPIAMTELCSE